MSTRTICDESGKRRDVSFVANKNRRYGNRHECAKRPSVSSATEAAGAPATPYRARSCPSVRGTSSPSGMRTESPAAVQKSGTSALRALSSGPTCICTAVTVAPTKGNTHSIECRPAASFSSGLPDAHCCRSAPNVACVEKPATVSRPTTMPFAGRAQSRAVAAVSVVPRAFARPHAVAVATSNGYRSHRPYVDHA